MLQSTAVYARQLQGRSGLLSRLRLVLVCIHALGLGWQQLLGRLLMLSLLHCETQLCYPDGGVKEMHMQVFFFL